LSSEITPVKEKNAKRIFLKEESLTFPKKGGENKEDEKSKEGVFRKN